MKEREREGGRHVVRERERERERVRVRVCVSEREREREREKSIDPPIEKLSINSM